MAADTITSVGTGDESSRTLNLMDENLKLLSITGVIPSKEICSGLWKYRAYRLCQVLSYILYTLVLVLQVLGLYHYWGDMVITTDNMAVTGTLMIGYIPTVFAIRNSSKICNLIDYLETRSILSFKRIRSNRKHMKIIQEAKSLASYVTWFALISLLITIFFWTVYPLVLLMVNGERALSRDAENLKAKFQYLVYVMWIPSDASHSYMYWIIYLLQVITFSKALIYLIGLLPLYLSLITYATAQFKIVSTALNEIDELATSASYQQENEGLINFKEIKVGFVGKFNSFVQNTSLLSGGQKDWENKCRPEPLETSALQSGAERQHRGTSTYIAPTEVSIYSSTNNAEIDSSTFMMAKCIQLHQSAISFVHDVDGVIGQCVMISSLGVTVLLVTQTFQLSMFASTKYVTAFLTSLTQLCVISWFGQGIINQSLAVGQTAYNCTWYERSTHFRRLLLTVLVRAQKPLHITLGKIVPLSIELFTLILNTAYKFYTVLLKLHES